MTNIARFVMIGTMLAGFQRSMEAIEGAFGRTVPGLWIMPHIGVVDPEPGFSFSIIPVGYRGSIEATMNPGIRGMRVALPAAGVLVPRIEIDGNGDYLVPRYVYKTSTRKVSFSSSVKVRVTWAAVTASLPLERGVRFTDTGLGDFIFSPLTMGIHFSSNNNLALSTMIFAPTAPFKEGNLSNLGAGAWTFMPNIGHTYIWRKYGLEFDNFVGFDISTRNNTTNYKSGTLFHWDGMVLKYFSRSTAAGAIVGNLTQITDDTGTLANLLHGFRGSGWGAGPAALYIAKLEKPTVIIQFRAVPEFAMTNLTQGITLLLGITMKWH